MKYVYITSARRNPDENVRVTRNEQLQKYYKLDLENRLPTYFVSYTNIPKLGINPKSHYMTPLGIYTYPVRFMYEQLINNTVPFAKDCPYLQVVERTTDKILCQELFTKSDYTAGVKKLQKYFINNKDKINSYILESIYRNSLQKDKAGDNVDAASLSNKQIFEALQAHAQIEYDRLIGDSKRKSKAPEASNWSQFKLITIFWLLTQEYAAALSNCNNKNSCGMKSSQVWRTLLTYLGYQVAIDRGFGFIHPNEPCQAVFFTKAALKHMDTISNISNLYKGTNKPKELRKFVNLTEKSFNRLVKVNSVLADIKGYGIYVDVNETGKLSFSPAGRDYKGNQDFTKAYITCEKPIVNCEININCRNMTLVNCNIKKSYCDKCVIDNCKFDDLLINNTDMSNSSGKYLEYIHSNISNCNIERRASTGIRNSYSHIENSKIASLASTKDDTVTNCKIAKLIGINEHSRFINSYIESVESRLSTLEFCEFENCTWGKKIDFSNPVYQNYSKDSPEAKSGSAIFINCDLREFYQELAEINSDVPKLKDCPDINLFSKRGQVVIRYGDISNLRLNNFIFRYPECYNCTITNGTFETGGEEGDKNRLFVTNCKLDKCTFKFVAGGITNSTISNGDIIVGYFYTGNIIEDTNIRGGYFYTVPKNHKGVDSRLLTGDPFVIIKNCFITTSSFGPVFERAKFINCDFSSSIDTNNPKMFINCKFE